jgi:hypothetical protein
MPLSEDDLPPSPSAYRPQEDGEDTPDPLRLVKMRFNLISALLQMYNDDLSGEFAHLKADAHQTLHLAAELGLAEIKYRDESPDVPDSVGLKLDWTVESKPPSDLHVLPKKFGHTGDYEWIGPEAGGSPKWLWDSRLSRTVRADAECLRDGYIAVSYTWGRWKIGEQFAGGTAWSLPQVNAAVFEDMLPSLKQIVASIPSSRYFWIDVLCINQDDPTELRKEISKQAAIFGAAKAGLVYLWSIDSAHELGRVMSSLGDLLLWSLQFSDWDAQKRSDLLDAQKFPWHIQRRLDGKLRLDPWFSSLWTLQEMTLAPSSIWMTRSGHWCSVNGQTVTTRLVAHAIQLLKWALDFRRFTWGSMTAGFPAADWARGILEGVVHLDSISDQETEAKDHWEQSVPLEEKESAERRVTDIELHNISFLQPTFRGIPDDIVPRYKEELRLSREVKRWVDWGTGEVCVNVAISATRSEILVAAVNRHSTKRRGAAVLAALKIAYQPNFDGEGLVPGGLPVALMQTIIDNETPTLFYVSHQPRQTVERRSHTSPLYAPLRRFPPPDGVRREDEPGIFNTYFTSTLPSDATCSLASRDLLLSGLSTYKFHPSWHLHPEGVLHIPKGNPIQKFGEDEAGFITFEINGFPDRNTCPLAKAGTVLPQHDMAGVLSMANCPCQFILLPLFFRQTEQQAEAFVSGGMKWSELQVTPGPSRDEGSAFSSAVAGVILAGHSLHLGWTSMTYWFKFGTYTATSCSLELLDWRNGILVGSFETWDKVSLDKHNCPLLRHSWNPLAGFNLGNPAEMKRLTIMNLAPPR